MSVIYAIKNLVNNKVYVGSSKSPQKRKYRHFYDMKKGTHHSPHLQKSYDKHGKDKFSFYILEECSEETRKAREIFFIEQFKSNEREFGYNIYEPNEDDFKCSEDTKKKISDSHKEKISVDLYKIDGEFIGSYVSIHNCSKQHNIRNGLLHQILFGCRKSYKGYVIVESGKPFNYTPSPKQRDMTKFRK